MNTCTYRSKSVLNNWRRDVREIEPTPMSSSKFVRVRRGNFSCETFPKPLSENATEYWWHMEIYSLNDIILYASNEKLNVAERFKGEANTRILSVNKKAICNFVEVEIFHASTLYSYTCKRTSLAFSKYIFLRLKLGFYVTTLNGRQREKLRPTVYFGLVRDVATCLRFMNFL